MTLQFPPHEVLLFIDTHLTTTESFENKNGQVNPCSNGIRLQVTCWSGLLLQLLSILPKHTRSENSEHTWEIIRAEHFLEVKFGNPFHPIEYTTSVNPYLFSLSTNLN